MDWRLTCGTLPIYELKLFLPYRLEHAIRASMIETTGSLLWHPMVHSSISFNELFLFQVKYTEEL